jgi:hypothetical protein
MQTGKYGNEALTQSIGLLLSADGRPVTTETYSCDVTGVLLSYK